MKASLVAYQKFAHPFGTPSFHIVLGSGFGEALGAANQWEEIGRLKFQEIPGLSPSTVEDHAGEFRMLKHLQTDQLVQVQMGRIHGYEGHTPQKAVLPVMLARLSGVQRFLLTNAAGGLKGEHMRPGDPMVIGDHINMTGSNPLVGPNPSGPDGRPLGPRFPDMGHLYSWRDELRSRLRKHFSAERVHEGVYLGLLGPTFETHAEVKLFSQWGVSAVGMSTVWEAIALRHSGAEVGGISLISNLAAGLDAQALDHNTILKTCRVSAAAILSAILEFVSMPGEHKG